jgi:hypothetical protein
MPRNPHLLKSLAFLRGQSSGIQMAIEFLESSQSMLRSRRTEIIALKSMLAPQEGGTNETLGYLLRKAEEWEKENGGGDD